MLGFLSDMGALCVTQFNPFKILLLSTAKRSSETTTMRLNSKTLTSSFYILPKATLKRFSFYLSLLSLLTISALFLGCDGNIKTTASGLLRLNPEQLLFSPLAEGQSDVREVSLSNVGAATLLIRDFEIRQAASVFSLAIRDGDGALTEVPEQLSLDPMGESVILVVTYTPDGTPTEGTEAVQFRTNSPTQLDVEIPIRTDGLVPQIRVTPISVDFGSVDAGEQEDVEVTLTNVGGGDLVLSRLSINGSEDFSALFQTEGDRDGELLNGEISPPIVIASGEARVIIARYAPQLSGADLGDIVLTTNDPNSPNLSVPLRANGASPCIQVTPESLDFGAGLLVSGPDAETPNLRPIIIQSCGGSTLEISRIEFEGAVFNFTEEITPHDEETLIAIPASNVEDATLPELVLDVGFWPTEEMNYGGRMLIYSNTSVEPTPVDLFGRGVANACPIPSTTIELYDVAPLEIITLDGTPSTDPGGEVERWEWTVVDRPSGSVSQVIESFENISDPTLGGPEDNLQTPQAVFFVDLAGRYEIDLVVYDNLDQASCAPTATARVVIEAIPEKDLHIQLVWSTPNDPDETDTDGTDIDLHLKHQNAQDRWGEGANDWDCFFYNKSPDWGTIGEFLDNPSLDIDDTNGAGPENINLDRPEVGVNYEIGALYYRSESVFGDPDRDPRIEHPSYVTTRVFARGDLIGEFIDQELIQRGQLWHIATVEWCEDPLQCPVVTPQGRVYDEGEYAN
jgi:hypothetical protein